jgi:hypothetical protein
MKHISIDIKVKNCHFKWYNALLTAYDVVMAAIFARNYSLTNYTTGCKTTINLGLRFQQT